MRMQCVLHLRRGAVAASGGSASHAWQRSLGRGARDDRGIQHILHRDFRCSSGNQFVQAKHRQHSHRRFWNLDGRQSGLGMRRLRYVVKAHHRNIRRHANICFLQGLAGAAQLVPAPARFNEMENIFLRYTGLIFADEMTVEEAMQAATDELAPVVTCD